MPRPPNPTSYYVLVEESPPPALSSEQLEINAKAEQAMQAIREIEQAMLPALDFDTTQAACRDHPPEWWFPSEEGSHRNGVKAKRICQACPVRDACAAWARQSPAAAVVGIWGGTSQRERRRSRRTRPRTRQFPAVPRDVCGTRAGVYAHKNRRETICRECKPIAREISREHAQKRRRAQGVKPVELQPCGTRAAYKRGCRCDRCTQANRDYQRRPMAQAAS